MEPTEIRDLVTTTLTDLGFGDAKSLGYHVLHRSRSYAGVHFAFERVSAIWLVDSDHLRFVDDTGKLLKIVRLRASQEVVGKAA
jgi:hypothetical protein